MGVKVREGGASSWGSKPRPSVQKGMTVDEQAQAVTLTREELDDAIEAAVQRGREDGPDVVQETKSIVDDVLGRINRNTIVGAILAYEVWTGHLNRVLDLVKLYLSANPGGV